jgi:hypothetical protein
MPHVSGADGRQICYQRLPRSASGILLSDPEQRLNDGVIGDKVDVLDVVQLAVLQLHRIEDGVHHLGDLVVVEFLWGGNRNCQSTCFRAWPI